MTLTRAKTDLIPIKGLFTCQTTRHDRLETILQCHGISERYVRRMNQTHSVNSCYVDENSPSIVEDCDAIYTDKANLCLVTKTADCLPIIVYHPHPVIAVIHAGRRGTTKGIITELLNQLIAHYRVHNGFYIWFGPAICKNCYEIDRESQTHFDLIGQNQAQIIQCLDPDNNQLIQSQICTCCQQENYYSYRGEGGGSERQYTMAFLPI